MSSSSEAARRHAPATARNRQPILEVLSRLLPRTGTVLEIASGTGEHGAWMADRLPGESRWQPSDPDPELRASIAAWGAGVARLLLPPLDLDVTRPGWDEAAEVPDAAAIVCINMVHIAPWAACQGLFAGAGRLLPPHAPIYLYGPFRRQGKHTAPSNEAFDRMLRQENPDWGVRDLETVAELAAAHGLAHEASLEMPANNLSVVFRRISSSSAS